MLCTYNNHGHKNLTTLLLFSFRCIWCCTFIWRLCLFRNLISLANPLLIVHGFSNWNQLWFIPRLGCLCSCVFVTRAIALPRVASGPVELPRQVLWFDWYSIRLEIRFLLVIGLVFIVLVFGFLLRFFAYLWFRLNFSHLIILNSWRCQSLCDSCDPLLLLL